MAVEIRLMKEEEAPILAALSKEVNWNHSFEECRATVTIPGSELYLLLVDGQVAGSAGAFVYGNEDIVFINIVIVREQYRRRGYASMMIQHILDAHKDAKTFRLHATPEGSLVYTHFGFETKRHLTYLVSEKVPVNKAVESLTNEVKVMDRTNWDWAIEFDKANFSLSRKELFNFNAKTFGHVAYGLEGKGFALARVGRKFRQIAALEADCVETALALVNKVALEDNTMPVSIVIYDQCSQFISKLKELNFVQTREMFDMELGVAGAEPDFDHYFAIYGGDLG